MWTSKASPRCTSKKSSPRKSRRFVSESDEETSSDDHDEDEDEDEEDKESDDVVEVKSDDSSSESAENSNSGNMPQQQTVALKGDQRVARTHRKIREVIGDEKLEKKTREALLAENEFKQRLEQKQRMRMQNKLQNLSQYAIASVASDETTTTTVATTSGVAAIGGSEQAADIVEPFCLDMDPVTEEPLVTVDKELARVLKKHQLDGIQFMWDACYDMVGMIEKGDKGNGCVLAHCMGLGKTLQVVTLVHTLLAHSDKTLTKRVLILVPKNVLTNWRAEFAKWTRSCKYKFNLFEMPYDLGKSTIDSRQVELERWFEQGGVCIMGYAIFTALVNNSKREAQSAERFNQYLCSPGADLIVCDEGHILKTEKTQVTKAVCQVATKRRIVLTGTPLQNNLEEYYCMVSFVQPDLLGTIKEFRNRFVNPINNGQHKDSTAADVRFMKKVSA